MGCLESGTPIETLGDDGGTYLGRLQCEDDSFQVKNFIKRGAIMKKIAFTIFMILFVSTAAYAAGNDIKASDITTAAELKSITKEIGYAIAIPSMVPADALGFVGPFGLGIDVGLELSVFKPEDSSGMFSDDSLVFTRLHVQKGLPYSIDIGVEYSELFDSNIKVIGVEVRKGIIEDGLASPAIGIRGTYSTVTSVEDLSLTTYGVDAQISKEFVFITPYLGASHLTSTGEVDGSKLGSEEETNTNVYAGVRVSMTIVNLTFQADFADINMYTLKLGLNF